jgi:hypothetical protein
MVEVGRTDGANWTCAGATASTLAGQTFQFYNYHPARCNITERMDACTSPDGKYKLITSFQPGWEYAVLLQEVATESDTFVYQGRLNIDAGVLWASNSRYVAVGIGATIQVIQVPGAAMMQAVSQYDDRQPGEYPVFSPAGTSMLYLKPAGGAGNADVFVVNVDGSGERNLTNAPTTRKLCPRWRW